MTIPYGFVRGEKRLPKIGEWYWYPWEGGYVSRAPINFLNNPQVILEPKDIPSGWEFVDYRVPLKEEYFLWRADEVPQWNSGGHYKDEVVIVRKKTKTDAESLLEEISKLSYTPPPVQPPTQTPSDIYGAEYLNSMSVNLTKAGWEVVGFRPLVKGDLYVYDPFGKDIRTYPDPTILKWPALIVRKKRVITDTERLDYFLSESAMFENREEIDEEIFAAEREERGE